MITIAAELFAAEVVSYEHEYVLHRSGSSYLCDVYHDARGALDAHGACDAYDVYDAHDARDAHDAHDGLLPQTHVLL